MIDIHLPEMIHKDLLAEHPSNSNKQSRHTYKELRNSIRQNGFDESITVVPRGEEDGYFIISGNHRFRAGVAEGMTEFPCVVRDDWDDIKEQLEIVRRNYVRGKLDKDAFTVAVDTLVDSNNLSLDEVRTAMGFEDSEQFLQFYKEEEEEQARIASQIAQERKSSAPAIKMIDDLGLVLSAIFEKYGDTVPSSFIIFPAGGKKHCFIAANPAIVRNIQDIAEFAMANHMDINMVLGGILAIGKHNSQVGKSNVDKDLIKTANEDEDGPEEF